MYDICHPSYYRISQLGCKNELKITTAFYIYMELCEEKKLWGVEYKYEQELDLIYLLAKTSKNADSETYIPWSSIRNLKLRDIVDIQNKLKCSSFILAVKSGEGISVMYRVCKDLIKPLAPSGISTKRESMVKKSKLDDEITRNSRNLYLLAKSRQTKNVNYNEEILYKIE
ncbi:tRNA-splicing endonuclease subunit Sen15-like [Cotesia glomerata]|uniref:tRNA-splicing endonuclease subunit Sen15 domain-containing protein n=1 Tax=Cotesia glomerata TaxID=32391 RepID=A0AAV7HWK8_COTGL|nr:tRNA-splicing endonuclease subunit Sen15-like [Cotesia glomerata]KAH0534917.1 hypothetical protein KQX54_010117 [Cotesia glomerata]